MGTEYTFTVSFTDGTQQILYDIVKSYVSVAPVIAVSAGGGSATFSWTNVGTVVPNASYYMVMVEGSDVFWSIDDLPLTQTSVDFNENGEAAWRLQSGQEYAVSIMIFNENDDYAYQFISFTMP